MKKSLLVFTLLATASVCVPLYAQTTPADVTAAPAPVVAAPVASAPAPAMPEAAAPAVAAPAAPIVSPATTTAPAGATPPVPALAPAASTPAPAATMTPAVAAPSAAETKPANTTAPTVAGDIPHDNNFTGKKVEVEEPTHAADERIAKDLKDGKPVVVAKHGKAKVEHEKKADAEKPKAEKKAVVKHAAKGKGDSVAAQKARDLRYHKDHPNDPNWQMVK